MNSKKGGALGSGIATIIAVIAVTIILLVFVFASGFLKMLADVRGGTKIYEGSQAGLGDVFQYSFEFLKLTQLRVDVANGQKINDAIIETKFGSEGVASVSNVINVPIARARYSSGDILNSKEFISCSAVIIDCGNKAVMAHATSTKEDYDYDYASVSIPEGSNVYVENVIGELLKLLKEKGINSKECKAIINAGLSESMEKIAADLGEANITIESSNFDKNLRDISYDPKTDKISITYPGGGNER